MRRKYVSELAEYTNRNVIVYYSGWLEKQALMNQGLVGFEVNDADKNGFMATIHGLDRNKGLDLILHTPGGDVAATESLVDYLRAMFDGDIRVIVPQLAMSAGTMIALAGRSIVMGKHSSLGPIDRFLNGYPAHAIVEEFNKARDEISTNPAAIPLWQPIISKYPPTLVGDCQKAIDLAKTMVTRWITTGMFLAQDDGQDLANQVVNKLADHGQTLTHGRHISTDEAKSMGIVVEQLEDDQELQEKVLTVHHACSGTVAETPAFKIIENQNGVSYISSVNVSSGTPQS